MESKKYELVKSDCIEKYDPYQELYRIRALRDFSDVKKGDLGGYVGCEQNLSHEHDCWIYDKAYVRLSAKVSDNARISEDARVTDNAKIRDNAKVYGSGCVSDNAIVCDNAEVYGLCHVHNSAVVSHEAEVYMRADVGGRAHVKGDCGGIYIHTGTIDAPYSPPSVRFIPHPFHKELLKENGLEDRSGGYKYELAEATESYEHRKGYPYNPLYRVRALKSFGCVKKGDMGGFIQGEHNLSQEGGCWVFDDAQVYDQAKISGNATIEQDATIYEKAEVSSWATVTGEAEVADHAEITSCAKVYENARVAGHVVVTDSSRVYGNANLWGHARVSDSAHVFGDAEAAGSADIAGDDRIDERIPGIYGIIHWTLKERHIPKRLRPGKVSGDYEKAVAKKEWKEFLEWNERCKKAGKDHFTEADLEGRNRKGNNNFRGFNPGECYNPNIVYGDRKKT